MEIQNTEPTKTPPAISQDNQRAKKYIIYMFIVFCIYFTGFIYFTFTLNYKPIHTKEKADAIIVLTGETHRIVKGVEELNNGTAPKLFISGVHLQGPLSKVIDKTILDLKESNKLSVSAEYLKSKIYTGQAENTIENALESATWVNKNNIKSIYLITSFYHMPRSKLLFEKYLPKTRIIYQPILFSKGYLNTLSDPNILSLIFSEYNKYLLTYIWNITGLETKTALKIQGVL